MLTKVGKMLRIMRLNNDEILKDMADKLNVSSAFLSAVENGKKKMPKAMRRKIITEYGLDQNQIFELDEAIMESNHTVEINIETMSDEKKKLAISFARSFGELSDKDVKVFADYLSNRSKEGKSFG